jgi:kynurenine formamidase
MKIQTKRLAAMGVMALAAMGIVAIRTRTRNSTVSVGPLPGFAKVVFLSHVNDPTTTPLYPGDPPFTIAPAFTIERDGFFLNLVTEGEHTGTHYGAPCHFTKGERCADELDARDFFRPAVVIDVRQQAAADANYEVTVADLEQFERRHGRIPDGAAVIGWTGWAGKWGTPAYPNLDDHGHMHQPGFGLEAARWLIANRALGALGTDTFGPEAATDTEFRVSSLVLHDHRLSLENLTGLDQMPPTGGWLVVGGTRNKHGSGSPATIFGLVP